MTTPPHMVAYRTVTVTITLLILAGVGLGLAGLGPFHALAAVTAIVTGLNPSFDIPGVTL